MNWIYFTAGFLSFPVLVLLGLLWIRKRTNVDPAAVSDPDQLQQLVGQLFRSGKHGDVLYILDRGSEFIVRVIKIERKTKKNTLKVEIRASDKNAGGYLSAKDVLRDRGIEFDEVFTPKQKKPSRMFLKNSDGGVFTVSSMTQAIVQIMKTINDGNQLDVLASDKDPHFWNKVGTEHVPGHVR
jgi:hypothetical protein